MNSFVKQFLAFVKGDEPEVLAQKAWRQANSALSSQISSRKGDIVSFEDKVLEAKEHLAKARVNFGNPIIIGEKNVYIQNLINAKNDVIKAEKELRNYLEVTEFLETELAALGKEE